MDTTPLWHAKHCKKCEKIILNALDLRNDKRLNPLLPPPPRIKTANKKRKETNFAKKMPSQQKFLHVETASLKEKN